jgi:O-antigen ligase
VLDVARGLAGSHCAVMSTAADTPAASGSLTGASRPRVPMRINWLVLLIVVMVGKVSDWVPGLSSIPLAKIAFLIAALAAFRGQAQLPAVRVRSLRIARPAIAFMTLGVVSICFSIFKSNTLITSELILILVMSMTLLLKVTQTQQDLERLLAAFAGAAASLSIGLLLNFHGGRGSINGYFDPNDIAYALVTLLPIVLALQARPSRLGRLMMKSLAAITVVAILLTGSRGGAIGLIVVTGLVIAFPLSRDAKGGLKGFSLGRTLVRAAILLGIVAFSWNYLPVDTRDRMATLLDLGHDYNTDESLKGSRTVIWKRDVRLALERPIGYGLGSAQIVDGLNGGQYREAHNSLVQAFVELGALGLFLYLYSYFSAWRHLGRLIESVQLAPADDARQKTALYARALRIALAGNLAAGFFLSNAYSPVLWLTIALAAALVRIADGAADTTVSLASPVADGSQGHASEHTVSGVISG